MTTSQIAQDALAQGRGILRLAPNWVPRSFCIPGRRLKLHPDDYYALGGERGGIDERWFSSATPADNGPLTGKNEGLSMVVFQDGPTSRQIILRDAIDELKGEIIGHRLWDEYGKWPAYSKFLTIRDPFLTTSINLTNTLPRWANWQAGGLLLSAPDEQLRGGFPLHFFWL